MADKNISTFLFDKDAQLREYYRLVDEQAELDKAAAPIQVELDKVNAEIQKLQEKANDLAAKKIEAKGGAADLIERKKIIGTLATLLGPKIPPRPTTQEPKSEEEAVPKTKKK